MDEMYPMFEKHGWNGCAKPLRYTFGEYEVSEVLMKGPDGVVLAAMQRYKPALVGFEFRKVSRIFNSSIITHDIELSHDFYTNKLGFQTFFQTPGNTRPNGPNVLGIPPNINGSITVPVNIYRPNIGGFGSIEILQMLELEGVDNAEYACPPNLGILMLRFPIRNADLYLDHLESHDVKIISQANDILLAPYGRVNIIVVRTPEGAWLEFVELLK